ncbi:MAG TPA: zinc metallopeptidase [Planctomycetaceae bacterium]|nr:zinc metallopeptidase [Planctomycetaceae bacterium]|tara:strand:- start:39261 stop:39941 length:681 start_codon:yes stop_codon:yes gene_type:complete
MFVFDPLYVLVVMLPGMLISGAASLAVRAAFNRYSQVAARRGITGAQAAQILLQRAGIGDVTIVPTHGDLSDHYNPSNRQLALSENVYNSSSVAAIGIACHEAGHAIQHAEKYAFLGMRTALVPLAGIGSSLGYLVMLVGLLMSMTHLLLVGAALFSLVLLFQVITLPVEFDASSRAKHLVLEAGIVDPDERKGIDRVLNAAALTYVAAVISSMLTLLYFFMRARE